MHIDDFFFPARVVNFALPKDAHHISPETSQESRFSFRDLKTVVPATGPFLAPKPHARSARKTN